MSSLGQSMSIQPSLEDAILFSTNEESLASVNLTQHACRLEQMSRYLTDAINKNRINLAELREVVKGQINQLKNQSQMLQSHCKAEADRLRQNFEPAIQIEIKKINQLKSDVTKINSEQLTTKKMILNLEASVSHCETEIGFKEIRTKR